MQARHVQNPINGLCAVLPKKYFKNPIIQEHDMKHEELLGVHPDDWCALVKQICLN